MTRYPLTNGSYADAIIQVGVDGNPITPGEVTIDSSSLATSANQIKLNSQLLGQYGVRNTSNTTAVTGDFIAIQVITDAIFSALTDTGSTGSLTGVTIPAGVTLYGQFTGYTLTSGIVRAYKAS